MTEPFMFATSAELPPGTYSYRAPVRFKDPEKAIRLILMDTPVMAGDREFYSADYVAENTDYAKAAIDNTAQIGFRLSRDRDVVSIRSSKASGIPCAAALLLQGPKRRARIMAAITDMLKKNGMPDAGSHYFVFVTPDEILMADKSKLRPGVLRKTLRNIKNRLESGDPGILLSTEVLEYDPAEDVFQEV